MLQSKSSMIRAIIIVVATTGVVAGTDSDCTRCYQINGPCVNTLCAHEPYDADGNCPTDYDDCGATDDDATTTSDTPECTHCAGETSGVCRSWGSDGQFDCTNRTNNVCPNEYHDCSTEKCWTNGRLSPSEVITALPGFKTCYGHLDNEIDCNCVCHPGYTDEECLTRAACTLSGTAQDADVHAGTIHCSDRGTVTGFTALSSTNYYPFTNWDESDCSCECTSGWGGESCTERTTCSSAMCESITTKFVCNFADDPAISDDDWCTVDKCCVEMKKCSEEFSEADVTCSDNLVFRGDTYCHGEACTKEECCGYPDDYVSDYGGTNDDDVAATTTISTTTVTTITTTTITTAVPSAVSVTVSLVDIPQAQVDTPTSAFFDVLATGVLSKVAPTNTESDKVKSIHFMQGDTVLYVWTPTNQRVRRESDGSSSTDTDNVNADVAATLIFEGDVNMNDLALKVAFTDVQTSHGNIKLESVVARIVAPASDAEKYTIYKKSTQCEFEKCVDTTKLCAPPSDGGIIEAIKIAKSPFKNFHASHATPCTKLIKRTKGFKHEGGSDVYAVTCTTAGNVHVHMDKGMRCHKIMDDGSLQNCGSAGVCKCSCTSTATTRHRRQNTPPGNSVLLSTSTGTSTTTKKKSTDTDDTIALIAALAGCIAVACLLFYAAKKNVVASTIDKYDRIPLDNF